MRLPVVAGNWKMNTTVEEAVALAGRLRAGLDEIPGVETVVCPPFVSLVAVKIVIEGSAVRLGAQNMFYQEKGAYTGEISPPMLADLCHYVIIGHSERRQHFGETDEAVNRKLKAALGIGLKPIFCVGETLDEKEVGGMEDVLNRQLTQGLAGIEDPVGMVIGYEPVWAIGTGRAATGQQANDTIGFIRRRLAGLYSGETADGIRIQYGGSVNADNIAEFVSQPEIDGALVGGTSLKAEQFVSIVRQTAEIWGRLSA
ncbi:MAG: triose-phosphate isomerase [Dehalococcoidales bacterium]